MQFPLVFTNLFIQHSRISLGGFTKWNNVLKYMIVFGQLKSTDFILWNHRDMPLLVQFIYSSMFHLVIAISCDFLSFWCCLNWAYHIQSSKYLFVKHNQVCLRYLNIINIDLVFSRAILIILNFRNKSI